MGIKKLYVFTTDTKEKIDEMLVKQDELVSETEGDVLTIFATSIENAIDKMMNVERAEPYEYHSVILHDGTVFGIDREELDG